MFGKHLTFCTTVHVRFTAHFKVSFHLHVYVDQLNVESYQVKARNA